MNLFIKHFFRYLFSLVLCLAFSMGIFAEAADSVPDQNLEAQPKNADTNFWSYYIATSPIADIYKRPNLSAEIVIYQRFTLGLKASGFFDAREFYGFTSSSTADGQVVEARVKGFEIGPQLGMLLPLEFLENVIGTWYLKPRLGIYRSVMHYEGSKSCYHNAGLDYACRSSNGFNGWVGEVMAMLHKPIYERLHGEFGAGLSTQGLLMEMNLGYAF